MSDRLQILTNIRRSLGRDALAPAQQQPLEAALAAPQPNLIPAQTRLNGAALLERFVTKAEAALASVQRLGNLDELPAAIEAYLRQHQLPAALTVPESGLAALLGPQPLPFALLQRPARSGDAACLTGCFAAMAETGSVVLRSGAELPIGSGYLPDSHLVLLRSEQIVDCYESLWRKVRAELGTMPRSLNWITGPSRSADIGMSMQMGAHGPIRLHLLLLESP
ncbi:MAG TPA: lactate utilization protein [Pseudomonadales bacterium]|jgi:L-lactate dehydrogenase complex protein LldG|nr:lactate utilization protein [Pseudomonadales bacterium]HMW14106.1 lactate utilization protein [Pseudomonadales bacterium]HMW84237.1 lactate utilization protein [Pseudomonadales bacterium]HMY97949.1 lactate utilization protein [Pseudomonadales bacterium]HMZ71958.1 lactate utilization protein [Pseudomonadales bacterium]